VPGCRRYARLYLADIRDTDYRTKTFSSCRCGANGALAITEPNTETGMTDYQLDQVEGPQHHPGAVARLTWPPKPAHRLSAKHYGVKAPARDRLNSSVAPVPAWQAQVYQWPDQPAA
jgi:hypothetical protein